MRYTRLFFLVVSFFFVDDLFAESLRLASTPALSPDGERLAFSWAGDIWTAKSNGGSVRQLTSASSSEMSPIYSPDGKQIAFTSNRTGSDQVFLIPERGGTPKQVTFHTEGYLLQDWFPDGKSLLVSASRDLFWREPQRFFRVNLEQRIADELLFDAYGENGRLSADGKQLLFTREGERWWRKGYRGSRASQIWSFDLDTGKYGELIKREDESRDPIWMPDQSGFYYVSAQSDSMNLWAYDLKTKKETQLTDFEDDSVISPCLSRDGSTIVFRHLFDLYRLRIGEDEKPKRLKLNFHGDHERQGTLRRTLDKATDVAFSKDGLDIAFISGGDLWVMETELREPIQITNTPEEESDPVFSPDGDAIIYISDSEGETDIWRVTRADAKQYWWQNESFTKKKLTNDAAVEFSLQWSPAGNRIAYLRERGDLWVMNVDGGEPSRILSSWNSPDYDWSPDGKWLTYAVSDSDFNRDVFVVPLDSSREPFNISRHPDNDYSPKWSPDGKVIAFTGRRVGEDVDIYFVYLQVEDSESNVRDRKIEKAVEKIKKVRKAPAKKKKGDDENKEDEKKDEDESKLPEVRIDFDGIHDRLRRVSIENTTESDLFWSHDSKKLVFTAGIDGKRGTYTISPPDELKAKLLSTKTGSHARWISQGNQIVWLADDKPGSLSATGTSETFSFSVKQAVKVAGRNEAAFDQAWRAMRDHFYDGRFNNRNWDAIRRKYREMARQAVDSGTLSRVVNLMLGELNASHLGFYPSSDKEKSEDWRETTVHLGARFVRGYRGPGLKIRDVLLDGPASEVKSKLIAGEVILSIDGESVDPAKDLTTILNGRLDRNIKLQVRNVEGEERMVTLRPISYSKARSLLYEKWIDDNQAAVDKASDGKFGYLHIRGMNMSSFYRFERELYSVGSGKDAIIIDVRENGGGFTTDHLLTVLTQPSHAITVPRGGGLGYPQDRSVYATWRRPIVVLCNQNSFSNAEIFSHAIKTLKRGKLVGVPTAGGVISTGGANIMDVGFLRLPFRAWFVKGTGEDMELNGAVPHHILWPKPGELPSGIDRQLNKAIGVLKNDVKRWKRHPVPTLQYNSERE